MFKKFFVSSIVISSLLSMPAMALDLPANKLVDAKWLNANKEDKSLIIIDIREKGEAYKKAHIPGAIHWSKKDFREKRYDGVPGYLPAPATFTKLMRNSGITKESNVVFYSGGNAKDSYTIATLGVYVAEYYGFKNTAILNGGFAGWKVENFNVDSEIIKPKKSDWKITSMTLADIADSSEVDMAVELGGVQLVDARGDAQAFGKKKNKKVKKAGHIPGAKHLFVGNFSKKINGIYYLVNKKTAEEVIQKAKIDTNKPIIWYCNSGWNASGDWFIGKYIVGLKKTKVYEGSMIDYSRLPNRKLIKGEF